MEELLSLPHVGSSDKPYFCWVTDFPKFQLLYIDQLENMTFNQQIVAALEIPAIKEIFSHDIVLDNITGEIIASRCWIYVNNLDINDVNDQLNFYDDQSKVTEAQPINRGKWNEQSFFNFEYIHFVWVRTG